MGEGGVTWNEKFGLQIVDQNEIARYMFPFDEFWDRYDSTIKAGLHVRRKHKKGTRSFFLHLCLCLRRPGACVVSRRTCKPAFMRFQASYSCAVVVR